MYLNLQFIFSDTRPEYKRLYELKKQEEMELRRQQADRRRQDQVYRTGENEKRQGMHPKSLLFHSCLWGWFNSHGCRERTHQYRRADR